MGGRHDDHDHSPVRVTSDTWAVPYVPGRPAAGRSVLCRTGRGSPLPVNLSAVRGVLGTWRTWKPGAPCRPRGRWLDLPEREIAAAMGVSPGTVKSHISRGLATLARALEAQKVKDTT